MANELYRINEPGGIFFKDRTWPEHVEFDLLAEGWGQGDIEAALRSRMITKTGKFTPEEKPKPTKTLDTKPLKEDEDA